MLLFAGDNALLHSEVLLKVPNRKKCTQHMGYLGAIVVEKFGKDTKGRGTASSGDEIY